MLRVIVIVCVESSYTGSCTLEIIGTIQQSIGLKSLKPFRYGIINL
jgi:hypothetical protein